MPDVADGSIASWVQAGGVVAFATAVLWELRALKPTMRKIEDVLAAMLERDRIRDTRSRRNDSSGPHYPRQATRPMWSDNETTDLHSLVEMKREGKARSTPAHGVRTAQPGKRTDRPFDDED